MRQKKELNVELGEQIRHARITAHLTQERLAELIDVSPQYVSDLERGVVGLSVATLRRLCIVLRVSSDSILFPDAGPRAADFQSAASIRGLTDRQRSLLATITDCYLEAVTSAGAE